MRRYKFPFIILIIVSALIASEPALAGPGGKIASAAFETFWGRIVLAILAIIFLPLTCYVMINERIAERRTRKDLRFMANYSSLFEWLKVQERAKDCFYRVHSGWENEELSNISDWMTSWYWQNQQHIHLERWKREGLINICHVKKITNIKPLLFVHRNHDNQHEDSMVVISISAKMKDFLQDRESGKVVEGSKKYKVVETIWSFNLENGQWKVSDIEDDDMSLTYAKTMKELPKIESTVEGDLRA